MCIEGDQHARYVTEARPLVGLRGFYSRLQSLHYGGHDDWKTGTARARCRKRSWPSEGHLAPQTDCKCGLHAYTSDAALRHYARDATVRAKVIGWGRVFVGDNGFRAEFMRIVSISDRSLADRLGVEYDSKPSLENAATAA